MLGFRESLQKLENSEEFKSYKKHNPDSYVINMIYLDEIEFNFFSPKTKIVTVFNIGKDIAFKELEKEKRTFPELEVKKINIELSEAMDLFEEERKKFCKTEEASKTIIILQQSSEPIWNLSQLTSVMKILHVLISAETGNIIESSYKQIIEKY